MTNEHDRQFKQGMGLITARFANALRKGVPEILIGGASGRSAKYMLLSAANIAKSETEHVARTWIKFTVKEHVMQGEAMIRLAMTPRVIAAAGLVPKVGFSTSFGGPNYRLIDRLERSLAGDLAQVADGFPRVVPVILRRAQLPAALDRSVTQEMINGQVDKQTLRQIQRRTLEVTGLGESDKVILTGGRVYDADYYTNMLVQTRTREATNDAIVNDWTTQGGEYIKMSEHTGVDPKDICFALQGKVWAIYANDPLGFPQLPKERGTPPWHPHCSHLPGPWVAELHSDGEVQAELDAHSDDEELMSAVRN